MKSLDNESNEPNSGKEPTDLGFGIGFDRNIPENIKDWYWRKIMTKEFKEIIHNFLTTYEQANELPILRPMSHNQCNYLLNIAVDILRYLENNND